MTDEEMADVLRSHGYLVVKVPECNKDYGHGKHVLITRSGVCQGKEPIPHGYHSSHVGTFGMWVNCQCGKSFSDCTDDPTPWGLHKAENHL